jgi:hypothetical protein
MQQKKRENYRVEEIDRLVFVDGEETPLSGRHGLKTVRQKVQAIAAWKRSIHGRRNRPLLST